MTTPGSARPVVLLLDDDPAERARTGAALRRALPDASVAEVLDEPALDVALSGAAADAVVTEQRLDWGDGFQVLEAVRSRWPDCPVVLHPSAGGEELAVRAMRAGFADYVRKGADDARLAGALHEAIAAGGRRRRGRELEAERQALFARERYAREAAEAALRAKDEILATVSHELRAPLNAILGWAQLLHTRLADDPTAIRGLEVILRSVRVQARMVEDLLDLSRAVSGRLDVRPRPLALAPVVQDVVDMLRPEATAAQVTLEARLSGDVGPVPADPDRFRQIVWNLLSNALRFTPAGGTVSVLLASDAGRAHLVVADTGEGIEPDLLPHVFEPFRHQGATRRRRDGGLGLGLAIVRHLVEAHGGRVEATSAGAGQGSTFRVTLPRARQPAASPAPPVPPPDAAVLAAARPPQPAAGAGPLAGISILVVDDHPDTRVVLRAALQHAGADVRAASDGDAALAALAERPADVVVSDIAMPGGGGYALLKGLQARTATGAAPASTLAITSYPGTEDRRRALEAGFDEYLTKPYEVAHLVATVRALAARRQSGER